ncbi:MAG: hypothetical protein HY290_10855 [Planctomycetia bacterium]|nr:hypothetical protein [Planctomycetia bacterium]
MNSKLRMATRVGPDSLLSSGNEWKEESIGFATGFWLASELSNGDECGI